MVSLAQLQEILPENMMLLIGPPGTGKPDFCQRVILRRLATYRPIIYVMTEYGPSKAEAYLKERGLGEIEPGLLHYIDAYNETVGLSVPDRPDTVHADCSNLSSIGIAISKLQERINEKDVLLVFDSLVSPYLLSGKEVLRFLRLTLSRFAAEGNSILMCMDTGSAKQEDLSTMMSLANGVISVEAENGKRMLNVIKHPKMEATRIKFPKDKILEKLWDMSLWDEEFMASSRRMMEGGPFAQVREEMGNFVNLFWLNLVHWSGMLWDPRSFPKIMYEFSKMHGEGMKEMFSGMPWHQRLLFKRLLPKRLSRVKDMKKVVKMFQKFLKPTLNGFFDYLEDISSTDEHYIRFSESFECWGLENVGIATASMLPPSFAGSCKGIESWRGLERDWNAIETKCIGLGDSYCEIKVVPGEIDELQDSLAKDILVLERINERLIHNLIGFMLDEKPLVKKRPKLGNEVFLNAVLHTMLHPALACERTRMALRMGGTKVGKETGKHLMEAGKSEDEAEKYVLKFFEHCKVGKLTADETIKMKENCESMIYKFMTKKREEPTCYFTTGFLNGFFSAVKNQHIKETKCIAMGDPYCEWELR